jgi:hypothetical protein
MEVDINPRFKDLNLGIMFVVDNIYQIGWIVGCIILHMKKVLPFRVLLLEG